MALKGKTALVTGGGSGIGAAIAKALSAHGAKVMLAGRRLARLEGVALDIEAQGGRVVFEACDVADPDQCGRLVDSALRRLGRLDVLVNNAGIVAHGKLMAAYTCDEWDTVMNTNVRSSFLLAKAAIPAMVEQGGGHVVNISSVSGIRCYAGESIYGISKHALNALTRFITEEYGSRGIRALAICPGLTNTDMGLSLKPERHERLLVPEDIAEAVVWALGQRPPVRIEGPIVLEPREDPWDGKWLPTRESD
jgi:NAD(P)-dependent dehydrogenase (short-subunit alcohol dehydrogenase family)